MTAEQPAPILETEKLCFGYRDGEPTLLDVDFRLDVRERIGLTGAIGGGKSTLLSLLLGFLKPTAGAVHAFGVKRVVESDFWEVRVKVGLLFQNPDDQLFCPTVLEELMFGPVNIGFSTNEAERESRRLLAELGAEGLADRSPDRLSFGQKRLISLASVLTMRPTAILLDEPTEGLDATSRERLLNVIERTDASFLVVSHDLDALARLTSRRLRLEGGRLREDSI
jgi:cobalt/nickel transport system ATP-binding protein